MPIFRYDSDGYPGTSTPGTPEWKAMSNIYRWNGSVWQKIKKIYRFNNTIAAKWQLVFSGTDAPQPKSPFSSLYRASDGQTEPLYSGNTVRLSRGGWTQNPTSYRLRIQTSLNAASGYTSVADQTYNSSSSPTASSTTDSTYISYTITDSDALYPSYYIKGLVQATNADGTTPLETAAILLRIGFTLSNLSASSITSYGATFSWNISGVPDQTSYIYDQTLTIRRVSDNFVVKTVNIAAGTNTAYINDSASLAPNTAYYAKLVVTANDSWRDSATSPTTRTIDNYLFTTAGNPPQNTVAPIITPLNNRSYLPVSTELTANKGTWSNVSASTTYEYDWWIEDGITGVVTNSGYIGSTRTYTSIYAGDFLFVRVKATNPDGTFGTAVSQTYILDQAVAVSQVTPVTAFPNTSTNFSFSISHYPNSYIVDWGDGTSNSYTVSANTSTVNQTIAHTYSSSGNKIITITAQPGSKQSLTSIDVNYPLPGNLTSVESYNFTAGNAQSFFTTGNNTTKVLYYYDCISIPSLSTTTYTQNTVSNFPYKIQTNLLSQFTLDTWNSDTYSPSTTYFLNNTVWYAGNQYRLTTTIYRSTPPYDELGVSGQVPTNTSYWTRIQTITYTPGDYVLYNGAYYFCKVSTNGTYPTNTTYWIPDSTGISFQLYATPYNIDRAGTQSAASNIIIRVSTATSPLQISETPTFSNITQSAFRTTFLPSVYTNQVDFYIQKVSDATYPTGYNPKVINVSGASYNNHDTTVALTSLTQYLVTINARYVYNSTYGIYHDGSGLSAYVTTAPPPPTLSNATLSDITDTPSQASSISVSGSSSNIATISWANGSPATSISVAYSGAGTSGSPHVDSTSPFDTSITRSYTSSGTISVTVTTTNNNKKARISWNQTNTASYAITYTLSGIGAVTDYGNNTGSSVNYDITIGSTSRVVTLNSITLYSGANQTGTSSTYNFSSSVTPADKTSSGSGSGSVTYSSPIPVNTVAPTLAPTSIAVGTTLTAGVGSWINSPTSYDIRIYRGTAGVIMSETLVASGTGTTLNYTVTQADYDSGQRYFRTYVSASNAGGSSAFVAGQERGPIAAPTTYTVTWNANGGSVSPTSNSGVSGTVIYAPTPTRSGYTFLYWRDTPSGDYLYSLNAGASWTIFDTRTFYARWQAVSGSAPATPTGLVNVYNGGTSYTFSWDPSSGATSYQIIPYHATDGSGTGSTAKASRNFTSGSTYDSSVDGGTSSTYVSFAVRATNANGSSAYSAIYTPYR